MGMPDPDTIRAWLIDRIRAEAGLALDAGDVHTPFAGLGLDSAKLAAVGGDLERWVGRPVDPAALFEYPTIAQLADHLVAAAPATGRDPRVPPPITDGAIAITGLACRFPGARGIDDFWRMLEEGTDAVREVPEQRWESLSSHNADSTASGGMPSRWGGFIDSVDRFDARFFRISADEAQRMDPQQRLLLETCWDALEDAGEQPPALRGSSTGVYVGVSVNDYLARQLADHEGIGPHTTTGNSLAVAANRLSYAFDLRGPSIAVDTACSSSLVAAHLACRALRSADCERAIVGGVNLMLDPEITIGLGRAGMLAADGRCRPFDARASGYVRGEGCGVVVLKPLSTAIAEGDRVYAVIRGSAVNQDGASNGLTAPNPAAQRAVVKAAFLDAGIDPATTGYVECHGTGTPLGDPIEAHALAAVVGGNRANGAPCIIGSVKSNLGHLEAAAGIAGLTKLALTMHHRRIPASLHFLQPNPRIPFDELGLSVAAAPAPWPTNGPDAAPAGISSFGFGGTNAHMVLTQAPPAGRSTRTGRPLALPMSARSRPALVRLIQDFDARLACAGSANEIAAVAFTAATRRSRHRPLRVAICARDEPDLASRVQEAAGDPRAFAQRPGELGPTVPRVTFVYSGQGSQCPGMGQALLASDRLFASAIRRCDEDLDGELAWSVERVLSGDDKRDVTDTAVAQVLIVAFGIALTEVWRGRGVEPAATIGHSVGEITSAWAAGLLDRRAALQLAALRGRAMSQDRGRGRMLAVGLDRDGATNYAERLPGRIAVAALNGPASSVLSGDAGALDDVRRELSELGVFARWLDVRYAFHSPAMASAARALAAETGATATAPPTIPWYSTVLGRRVDKGDVDADYWGSGVRAPVDFDAAVTSLLADGTDVLLEVSPQPVLGRDLRELARARSARPPAVLASLDAERDEPYTLLQATCKLYELGCPVRWHALYPDGGRVVSLPSHPWERESFWIERPQRIVARRAAAHPVLGTRVDLAHDDGRLIWENVISKDALPCLEDHEVGGELLLPASAYVDVALAAGEQAGLPGPLELTGMRMHRKLPLAKASRIVLQTTLAPEATGGSAISIHARPMEGGGWALHASGQLGAAAIGRPEPLDVTGAELRCLDNVPPEALYRILAEQGLAYGRRFRGVIKAAAGEREAFGLIDVPIDSASPGSERLRLLDAASHLVALAAGLPARHEADGTPPLPVGVDAVRVWSAPALPARVHASVTPHPDGGLSAALAILDTRGLPAIEVVGLRLVRATRQRAPAAGTALFLYEPRWHSRPLPDKSPAALAGTWLVVTDKAGVGAALSRDLLAAGATATQCAPTTWRSESAGLLHIDSSRPDDYERVVAATAPSGVVFLAALDGAAGASADAALLRLIQAASRASTPAPRLIVATRGSQPAGTIGGVADPAGAMLWGMAKTALVENPLLRIECVDLDPSRVAPAHDAAALLAEVAADTSDTEVAYRNGGRLVSQLIEAPQPTACTARIGVSSDGTYVVTGGLGALGLLVAERLAARGGGRISLLARHATAEAAAEIQSLTPNGTRVEAIEADVRDRDGLAAALEQIRAGGPPIRGVLHAAGVLRDGAILDMTADALADVTGPKLLGAHNLHELTRGDPLDWFVLFSSAAGVLASPGQANYAAANAYLDALAHHRRGQGLPAIAIDWGPWAAGMGGSAANAGPRGRLRTGAAAIAPKDGLALFEHLVAEDRAQVVVLPFDLRNLLQFYPAGATGTFFEAIATTDTQQEKSVAVQSSARPDLATGYVAPRTELERRIAAVWQRALGIEPIGALDRFFDLGGDSVLANQILVELNRSLGVSIEPERAFADLTVARLAELAEEQAINRIGRLTDAEANALLTRLE